MPKFWFENLNEPPKRLTSNFGARRSKFKDLPALQEQKHLSLHSNQFLPKFGYQAKMQLLEYSALIIA